METKVITKCGIIAALYVVLTLIITPVAYGPLQFRVSELLKPLALFSPWLTLAFAIGNTGANLMSPFGPWDYIVMPLIDALAAWACWRLRKYPIVACVFQSIIISIGVSVFPLWQGGGLSPLITFPAVLISEIIIIVSAWIIVWKPRREMICNILS